MTSDLPPPLVDTDGRLLARSRITDDDDAVLGQLAAPGPDLAFTPKYPVHEAVELRLFRKVIRRRAHLHAFLRVVAVSALAALFVFTFIADMSRNKSQMGFAPKVVAAR